ncbi:MAG: DUF2079 domain-containing protein [Polyangiaceae bacterium]|nr:DUF2079 domain-containing protein [Polyangiaceae bacterium]
MTRWLAAGAVFGCVGASLGFAIWTLGHPQLLPHYLSTNVIDRGHRLALLVWMGGMASSLVAATVLALVLQGSERAIHGVERWRYLLAPAVMTGPIVLLFHWRAWGRNDLPFLGLATVVVVGLRPLVEQALAHARWDLHVPQWLPGRWRRIGPWSLALGSAVFFATFFGYFTVHNHYNLCTQAFDLGVEHNVVYNTMFEGEFLRSTPLGGSFSHKGYHQTYFTYLIGLFYLVAPYVETLLVIQALVVGAAVIPIFLLARRLAGTGTATTLAVAFSFYAPAQGGIMYDFHYQPFSVFFIPLIYYLFLTRRDIGLLAAIILHLSLREDMGIPLGALAAFLALTGQRPRVAVAILAVCSAHFVLFKFVIMPPYLQGAEAYTYMFQRLVARDIGGFAGVLATVIGNPGYLLNTVLTPDRLEYVLLIFLPMAFLPLTRPSGWLLAIPGAMFTLMTTDVTASVMISFQYTALWTPFVFIGTAWAIASVEGSTKAVAARRRAAWLFALATGLLVTTVRYGYVFQDETTLSAWDPVHFGSTARDRRNHDDLYALIAQLGPNDKVVASEWLVPHLSNRRDIYALRYGVFDAEWLVFWHDLRGDERPHVERVLGRGEFSVIERRGKFVLARRGLASKKLNSETLAWLRTRYEDGPETRKNTLP